MRSLRERFAKPPRPTGPGDMNEKEGRFPDGKIASDYTSFRVFHYIHLQFCGSRRFRYVLHRSGQSHAARLRFLPHGYA